MGELQVPISVDALRMRCRRMCEAKPSGRKNVPDAVITDYKTGGESREILELALLECLSKHGVTRTSYKRVKASILLQSNIYNNC